MARLTWIPHVLRAAGLVVHESPGWQTRGAEGWSLDAINPAGIVAHATAGARNGNEAAEMRIVRDGREGLAGPIAQLFLQRNGHYTMLAAGVANHAGRGGAWGISGNQRVIGIEASNDNRGEPWPGAQYDAYVRGVAAMLDHLGLPESRVVAHREWSTSGKTDPVGIDMPTFRARVGRLLKGESPVTPQEIDQVAAEVVEKLLAANVPVPADVWNLFPAPLKVTAATRLPVSRLLYLGPLYAAQANANSQSDPDLDIPALAAAIVAELGPELASELAEGVGDQVQALLARTRVVTDPPASLPAP